MYDLFENYLDVLLNNTNIPSEELKKLKTKLIQAWLANTGRRLMSALNDEEKKLINIVTETFEQNTASEEVKQKLLTEVAQLAAKEDRLIVYREEALKIVDKLVDTYLQNASQDKIAKVKAELLAVK